MFEGIIAWFPIAITQMPTEDSAWIIEDYVSDGGSERIPAEHTPETHQVRCDGSGTATTDTEEPVEVKPCPVTEYYESFRSVKDIIKRIDPSVEDDTNPSPQAQYYRVINDIISQGHPEDDNRLGYGSQQADRVSHQTDDYREVHGNNDWIVEYQCLDTAEPEYACIERLEEDISSIPIEVNRPIPPDAEEPVPTVIENREDLEAALALLSNFPAMPGISPGNQGNSDTLPIEAIHKAQVEETDIEPVTLENSGDSEGETSSGLSKGQSVWNILTSITETIQNIINGSDDEDPKRDKSTDDLGEDSLDTEIIEKEKANKLLQESASGDAEFRSDQWTAIDKLANNRTRLLLIQRTGWGKSTVSFIVTKTLRDNGRGPTLVICPLIALMRDQTKNANQEFDLDAIRITSDNEHAWENHYDSIREGDCDLVYITPRRLQNQEFRDEILKDESVEFGMIVVDEAHSISYHGHDFRPDYKRVTELLGDMSANMPVLATTATAPENVVDDIEEELQITDTFRGDLYRPSLAIQAISIGNRAKRLAWLAENLPQGEQAGIVYCATRDDVEACVEWLRKREYDVLGYHSRIDSDEREKREKILQNNEVDALITTNALGMGIDKPDLRFVFHFQRPSNLLQYYQEIGRAGRELESAHAVILSGADDDDTAEYFIEKAFPNQSDFEAILDTLEATTEPLTRYEIQRESDASNVSRSCKILENEGIIENTVDGYVYNGDHWDYSEYDFHRFTESQYERLDDIQRFMETDRCLAKFIDEQLDGQMDGQCNQCANCTDDLYPRTIESNELIDEAMSHYKESGVDTIENRVYRYDDTGRRTKIPDEEQLNTGRSLALLNDPAFGRLVKKGKFGLGQFDERLVTASVELIQSEWDPSPPPEWITFVPSEYTEGLNENFANRLGEQLEIEVIDCIQRVRDTSRQGQIDSVYEQYKNVRNAFEVTAEVPNGPGLLVDDIVGSRWTLTEVGAQLNQAGSECVYPFALAQRR